MLTLFSTNPGTYEMNILFTNIIYPLLKPYTDLAVRTISLIHADI